MLLCPLCNVPLTAVEKEYRCPTGHSFDRAKSGYVNLLPANRKHSQFPGDNKLMVNARRDFLDNGYYEPLADALCAVAVKWLTNLGTTLPTVLDAGCGEGYYSQKLSEALTKNGIAPELLGIDISKFALEKAAKRLKTAEFAVGSVFHLPVGTGRCDLLCSLFAPYCGEEYSRVLKPGGAMLLVIPGENHLWELKQAIYEVPYKNVVKSFDLEGFLLLENQRIQNTITLANAEDIAHLFMMTPYYYKTGEADQLRLSKMNFLVTQTEFHVLLYQRA